ncbi:MAG: thioredoxin domain-containing protein [Candidatus Thermoplasmatota archaeon]
MTKRKKIFITVLTILSLFILFSFQTVSADQNKILLEYFYKEGCGSCEEVKPIIESIEQKYSEKLEVRKILMSVDFPVLILSTNQKYSYLTHDDIDKQNVENITAEYLAKTEKSKEKQVYIDFIYLSRDSEAYKEGYSKLNKSYVEDILNDIQKKYPEQLKIYKYEIETLPFIVVKNQTRNNSTLFTYDRIKNYEMNETIKKYVENMANIDSKDKTQSTPGFHIITVLLTFLLAALIYFKKKKS